MADLRLGRLPGRVRVKLTISISPELNRALSDCARAYERAYGDPESPAELVPAILESFLASDRAFLRMRNGLGRIFGYQLLVAAALGARRAYRQV